MKDDEQLFRIECRLDTVYPNGRVSLGEWYGWTKKYKSFSALWDAWKHWRTVDWRGSCGKPGKIDFTLVWRFRPIHFYQQLTDGSK